MTYLHEYQSPLGPLTLASDGENIVGLWMRGQKYFGQNLPKEAATRHVPVFDAAGEWLDEYFAGAVPRTKVPLAPRGGEFRLIVWELLLAIPHGETTTYREIAASVAKRLGRPSMSAQAVGGAVGHNPISIIIPCHRVLGSDGSLTGYAGGVEKKRWLLRLEAGK